MPTSNTCSTDLDSNAQDCNATWATFWRLVLWTTSDELNHPKACYQGRTQFYCGQPTRSYTMLPFSRRPKYRITPILLSLLLFTLPSHAIWPFPPKRFAGNSLIVAGSMGLDEDGRVVAFGDFDGNQLYVFLLILCCSIGESSTESRLCVAWICYRLAQINVLCLFTYGITVRQLFPTFYLH